MAAVFVLASDGRFVQHGPVRSSEKQAAGVARLLSHRLGWVCVAAEAAPKAPSPLPKGLPSPALAGLSPVWKDPGLAAQWAAAPRQRRGAVPPPPPAPVRRRGKKVVAPGAPTDPAAFVLPADAVGPAAE